MAETRAQEEAPQAGQAQILIHPWWLRGCWSPSGVQSGVPLLAQRRSCSVAEIVQCRQRLTEVLFLSVQYRYRNPIMGTKEKTVRLERNRMIMEYKSFSTNAASQFLCTVRGHICHQIVLLCHNYILKGH